MSDKLKIISVVGARPNFMKVAPLHRAFAERTEYAEHMIVHTGQHYDVNMSDAFFQDLEMPQPEYFLGVGSGSHASQTAKIMMEFEKICVEVKPDFLIVVGDVNSTVACALTAIKMGVKTAHVEAGLRSFDREMPEEINRMATDAICDYHFVTEQSAIRHLTHEGIDAKRIYFVGNTMIDSQVYALNKAMNSDILNKMELKKKEYALVTIHRPSNVDDLEQIKGILSIFEELSQKREIVFPMHPRTRKNLSNFGLDDRINSIEGLKITEPKGYIDFLALMLNCDFVLTDSGGIQEETTALGIPCITARTTTERPSTTEIGTNVLVEPVPEKILYAVNQMLDGERKRGRVPELWDGKAGERIADIIIHDIFKIEKNF
jgi:UDP-N-acetylglucosamine 2-epimerase (non-hydrolysing)